MNPCNSRNDEAAIYRIQNICLYFVLNYRPSSTNASRHTIFPELFPLLGKCIIFPTFVGANAPLLLLSSRLVMTLPARYPGFPMIFGSICSAGRRCHAAATLEVARSAAVSILVQHASAASVLWVGSADRHPCLLVCVDATRSSC